MSLAQRLRALADEVEVLERGQLVEAVPLAGARTIAHTDGSCEPNPGGVGSWAVVLSNGREFSGVVPAGDTTNNRMEIMGAIKALEHTAGPLTVRTDSAYLIGGATRAHKRKVNLDLWARLDQALAGREVIWEHVRGHAGYAENERADQLCTLARLG